jgi:hypothetical protein
MIAAQGGQSEAYEQTCSENWTRGCAATMHDDFRALQPTMRDKTYFLPSMPNGTRTRRRIPSDRGLRQSHATSGSTISETT